MSFKTKKIPEHLKIRPSTWEAPKKHHGWKFALMGIAIILVFSALQAMATDLESIGTGKLILSAADNVYQPAEHTHSEVDIKITGIVAKIIFTQTFINQSDRMQHARYMFPLSDKIAVKHMTVWIGDRKIEAVIKDKKLARKIFKQAKMQGKAAALIEQIRPNLFAQDFANLAPGEKIKIELTLIQTIDLNANEFELRFPTTFTPRYHSTSVIELSNSEASQFHGNKIGGVLKITASLDSRFDIADITSAYHDIKIKKEERYYHISLRHQVTKMNRDLVLNWRAVNSETPHMAAFHETIDNEDYLLLMLLPNFDSKHGVKNNNVTRHRENLPRELIFVIDTSGSMQGKSISQAKASLLSAITKLNNFDRFNIIEFNSGYSLLFPHSKLADHSTKAQSQLWVNNLSAGGGTEMFQPLSVALHSPTDDNVLK